MAIVVVAQRVEQSVAEVPTDALLDAAPLPIASLGTGTGNNGLTLDLEAGSATITGPDAGISVALTTTAIGDRTLGVGEIDQGSREVTQRWNGITEWYRTSGDGFEHGYTIEGPVAAGRVWDVLIDVADGEPELVDTDTVAITRSDGTTLWYRELHAYDDVGRELPATMDVVDGDISLTIDSTDASYPITVDPIITERVATPTGVAGDQLGLAVDIDDNTMVVSSPGADDGAAGAGHVEVYERTSIAAPWVLTATIHSPTPEIDGGFGDSLALRGDLLAIGESDAYGDIAEPGRVWVFEKVAGASWVSRGAFASPLDAELGDVGDRFGFDTAWIDDTKLLVGAPGAPNGGDVFRIDLVLGTAVQLNPVWPDKVAGDEFGFAVDVTSQPAGTGTGYWVAVGMPGRASRSDPPLPVGSGAAGGGGQYLITLDAAGTYSSFLRGEGFAYGTRAGTSVSIDGNRAVVGQYGTGGMGFETYEYRSYDPPAAPSWRGDVMRGAGASTTFEPGIPVNDYLEIDGDTIAVADPGDGGGAALFRFDEGVLSGAPVDSVRPPEGEIGDRIGRAIGLDGPTLIVGAPGDDGAANAALDAGTVYSARVPATMTFIDTAGTSQPWEDSANWDLGIVPGELDTAVVPVGSSAEVNAPTSVARLSVAGQLGKRGPGILDISDGWRSEWTSTVDIQQGEIVIAGTIAESSGSFQLEPGTSLRIPGQDFAPGRGSRLATRIIGPSTDPANFGHIEVGGDLAFDPAQGGPGELAMAATVDNGYTVRADDVYSFVTCGGTCAGGRPNVNGLDFDALDLQGGLQAVQTQSSLDFQLIPNKITSSNSTGFGTDIDVDGDWAVVGASGNGTAVLRRVGGVWELGQILTGTSGPNVAIDGNFLIAGGTIFERPTVGDPFTPTTPFGGSSVDTDGGLVIVGDPGTARVYDRVDLGTSVALVPDSPPGSYGTQVAVVDLGADNGVAAVSAPAIGAVYLFERIAGNWNPSPVATLTSPDGTPSHQFGNSLVLSADRLVIGEWFNNGDTGAAWVYERTGTGASYGTPTKLTGSNTDFADTFGSDVAIDGDTIVVGAGDHQKQNFPVRDGEAYVFQHDGSDWVETDNLRAADGFDQERFGDAVAVSGTSVLVGARMDVNAGGDGAGAVYTFDATPLTSISTGLTFDLALAVGSPTSVSVKPDGISVNQLDRTAVASRGGAANNVAASSISSIGPKDTALAGIKLGATPLSSIVLDSVPLSSIPLVKIDIDGGWTRIIEGSTLDREPLSSLTFGQVLAEGRATAPETPAGRLADAPLSSIDVDGTPLSSIPLSAIALGSTPLSAIPLSSIGFKWCEIVSDLVPNCVSEEDTRLEHLTVMEITLRGVPLSSIPLSSIPLSSIPLSSIPLSSIPLSSIDLSASPLSSIPLSSIPLSSIDVAGSPLSAIPLSSIPLSAIPLSSIPLSSIPLSSISTQRLLGLPTSVPLSSIPLSSIGPSGTPLSSIQLQGAPLSSIPLSSIVLADAPLSSIPLSSIPLSSIQVGAAWCDVLATARTRFNCDTGADPATTTLRQLSLNGVPLSSIPLSSIPLSSIPLSSIPLDSIPLSSIPLSSIPLSSIPLSSIPLSSIDIAGSPLSSIPLSSINVIGSPLSSIPLSSIPLSSIPLSSIPLSSIPLSSIPLSSIPLSSIDIDPSPLSSIPLSSIPLSSIDVIGSPLSSIPLSSIPLSSIGVNCSRVDCIRSTVGDAYAVGAIPGSTTLSQIQGGTQGIRLGELAPFFETFGSPELTAALGTLTLGSLDGRFDDLTLGDLGGALQQLAGVTLGQLQAALVGVTFQDLVGAIIDPITGRPLPGLDQMLRTEVDQEGTLIDLDTLGDVTIGDLLSEGYPITTAQLQPLLGFITVDTFQKAFGVNLTIPPDLKLEDLSSQQLGQLTLADLLAQAGATNLGDLLSEIDQDILAGFTFGDLLLALLDPASLAFGGVEFAQVDVGALPPGTVPPATFSSQFQLTGEVPHTVELEVIVPTAASFVPGSGTLETVDAGGGVTAVSVDPTVVGKSLRWSTLASPGATYTFNFDVLPALELGPTTLSGTARVEGTDITIPASASVTVEEGSEPNDFDLPGLETTAASENVVYLTYIASPTDNDVYEIHVAQDDKLVIQLSNLDADLDLVLWGRPDHAAGSAALAPTSDQAALFALTDPDGGGADAEPLHDFKRLDAIDPSLGLVQVTNQTGTASETLSTGRLDAGTYFIQVYGSNGTTNVRPAALQVKMLAAEAAPACQARGPLRFTSPGTAPSATDLAAANTLILVNEQRIEQLYDATGRSQVMTAANDLVGFLDNHPDLGIHPVIVPVDAYAAVHDAFSGWDSNPCEPDAANAIVRAINSEIIDPIRGHLDHIVFLGGDDLIPMARLDDSTLVANEYDFRHEFDGDLAGAGADGRDAFTSAFWESAILSDDPYGDAAARSLGNRYLYVPDLALGRLVETPTDIADALTTFVDFDGTLDIETATVLGYDFLADGSAQVAADLESAGLTVDDEYADGFRANGTTKWDRADATAKLVAAGTNALISLNAHFDHYRALPSIGDQVTNFSENLIAEQVAATLGPDALRQSLVFSMGCHSGLSVSDISIGTTNIDWAQTLAGEGSLFVGNSGFGYGDTATVAYTEHLMALFAAQLASPFDLDLSAAATSSTVGQALAWAKNDYVAGLQSFSVYDEKALMESTFYGLPFYRVGRPTSPLPPTPINQTVADSTGTPALQVSIDATNTPTSDPALGTYYSNADAAGAEQVIVSPGRPIQPKAVRDVSVLDPAAPRNLAQTATGAIVLDMNSTYVALANPVIATPIFDQASKQPEPEAGDNIFPTRQLQLTTSTGPGGERQQLVVATGQYRGDTGVQRLDDDMNVAVYYATPGAADHVAPAIGAVSPSITDGVLSVSIDASDAGGVDRVYVLVGTNPGVPGTAVDWTGFDLTRSGATDRWTGSLELSDDTTDVELIVQAKDRTGNVGYATNKARNFSTSSTPPPATPAPPATTLSVVPSRTNLDATSGWYTGPVTIEVVATATAATYFIDGEPRGPIAAGDAFQITSDGPHTWTVVNSGLLPVSGSVRIDTDGAPRISVGSPTSGATYTTGSTIKLDRRCEDTSLASCASTINGAPVANGAQVPTTPGSYTLVVTATDRLGNSSSTSIPFTIVAVSGQPTLSPMTGPTTPQNRMDGVSVSATFTDASAPFDTHTGVIDWGDGSTSQATIVEPTPTMDGTIAGSHTYGEPGVYAITMTLTDASGATDSRNYEFVVVYDPGAGRVSGAGLYYSNAESRPGGSRRGTMASFGYNARYKRGATAPTGQTQLKLIGDFFFRSTAYDYLIVNDTMAVAEGVGTIGGGSQYRFRVQGIDNGWVDFFQITIWDPASGDILYDNGVLYDDGDRVLLGGINVRS